MQRAAQRGVVAKFGIAEHGGDLEARRADLAQQREREPPFLLEPQRRRNLRALSRLGRQPRLGQIQRGAEHPRLHARPQRRGHGDLAIGDLAQGPAVLPGDRHRASALLRKAGPVENQHARALGDRRAQLPPQALGAPRRMRDEMLERLIRPRIGDALEHRAHRLAATVAEQAEQVATKGAALRDVTEAHLERLEPVAQLIEPRRSVARQSRQHRATAYRTCGKSTRANPSISCQSRNEMADLTKWLSPGDPRCRPVARYSVDTRPSIPASSEIADCRDADDAV